MWLQSYRDELSYTVYALQDCRNGSNTVLAYLGDHGSVVEETDAETTPRTAVISDKLYE
jgi:hypothetical protein